MNRQTSPESPVAFHVHEGVARIVLARPERSNALDAECRALLKEGLATVETREEVRAVILTGQGRAFCSGQDLAERCMDPGSDGGSRVAEILDNEYAPLVSALYHCSKPVVCAVNGVAYGGGVNLALACDIVLAAKSARFVQPYSRLGLSTDAGGSFFLPRLVGRARALGLLLLGEGIDADAAQQWGMIWRAVDDSDLSSLAWSIAAQLANGPTAALAAIKTSVNRADGHSLEQQLDNERDLQRALEQTVDYSEGRRAFLEKRRPAFR